MMYNSCQGCGCKVFISNSTKFNIYNMKNTITRKHKKSHNIYKILYLGLHVFDVLVK